MTPYGKMELMDERIGELMEQVSDLEAEIREKDERMGLLEQFGEAAWKEIAFLGKPNVMLYDWLSEQAGELGLR